MAAYAGNRDEAIGMAVEGDVVTAAIRNMMTQRTEPWAGRTLVPQPCIRWITPYHDACMRIGGEAPRWWTHS
jgi:hypothetical protein